MLEGFEPGFLDFTRVNQHPRSMNSRSRALGQVIPAPPPHTFIPERPLPNDSVLYDRMFNSAHNRCVEDCKDAGFALYYAGEVTAARAEFLMDQCAMDCPRATIYGAGVVAARGSTARDRLATQELQEISVGPRQAMAPVGVGEACVLGQYKYDSPPSASNPYGGSSLDPWNLDPMYFQKQFGSKKPTDDKPWTAGDWGLLAGLVLVGAYLFRGGNFRPRPEDRLGG